MNANHKSVLLKLFAIWTAARAAWMTYMLLLDLRSLKIDSHSGPYLGIGIDNRLVVTLGAMPSKMISIFAGFSFGRRGEVAVEILTATAYFLVAVGIWRWSKPGRVLALGLCGLESALLTYYLCGVVPFTFVPWPEPRLAALISGVIFLGIYASTFVYLLRQGGQTLLVDRTASAATL